MGLDRVQTEKVDSPDDRRNKVHLSNSDFGHTSQLL